MSSRQPRRTVRVTRPGRAPVPALAAWLAMALVAGAARAEKPAPPLASSRDDPSGMHVLDGSYVLNVSNLQVNLTNWGLIGSYPGMISTFSEAPSAQWPAGSGNEYLFAAGLWVGGVLNGQRHVSTGQYEAELRPRLEPKDTIYEARGGRLIRPVAGEALVGRRFPDAGKNDDRDGAIDEDPPDGYDDDGDGRVDEDFAQIGDQMLTCTMFDNTRLASEQYPDHEPMQLKVVQNGYAWSGDATDDFVGLEWTVTNIGVAPVQDVYIGFYADLDVGSRRNPTPFNDQYGRFEGLVMAETGEWVWVSVVYMRDAPELTSLPGYVGLLFLHHTVDPTGYYAPPSMSVRSFQAFAGEEPFAYGGAPTNDDERYRTMSAEEQELDSDLANDWSLLISSGPFPLLPPGRSIRYGLALVVGPGLEGLLTNCAAAVKTWGGLTYDVGDWDWDWIAGKDGRETLLCTDQVGPDGIDELIPWFGDQSCIDMHAGAPSSQLLAYLRVARDYEVRRQDGQECIWINLDNCQECSRLAGEPCTKENGLWQVYNCIEEFGLDPTASTACTGILGRETRVPWSTLVSPPPPPAFRLVPDQRAVHVLWDDSSERARDSYTGQADFESYAIWRSDDWDRPLGSSVENGPPATTWRKIAEFDLDDQMVIERTLAGSSTVERDTVPLGRNTGLEVVRYVPRCLSDAAFAGLAQAMQAVVDADTAGRLAARPSLRDGENRVRPGLEALLPWEAHPAVLDTFFLAAERAADPAAGVVGKTPSRFYEYVDREVHNGFLYFYSVSAADRTLGLRDASWVCLGPGLSGDPGLSFAAVTPGTPAWTPEQTAAQQPPVYVYPNPATARSLDEFQRMQPNQDDPTGRRVAFANLPRARNHIRIFTEDGDLVQELWHDGTDGHGETTWNLVSRNGQQVVSGIYIYAVESDDPHFRRFIGKFVLIW